jgi:hypothetical protein
MHCPQCGYQTDDYALSTSCALCGSGFAGTGSVDSQGKRTAAGRNRSLPPGSGQFKPLLRAFSDSVGRPSSFFSGLATRISSWQALIYGLVTGSIGMLLAAGSTAIFPPEISPLIGGNGMYRHATRYTHVILVLSPAILTLQYLLSSAYIQVMLKITGSRPKPFATTFKTLCYTGGSHLLEWIPVAGPLFAFSAWMYLAINGLHVVHGISRVRAATAILLPIVLLFVLLALMLVIAFAGVAMVGGSQPDFLKFLHR